MSDGFKNLPEDPELARTAVESITAIDRQLVDQGMLGKLWGRSSNIPNNIAALSIIILLLFGVLYSIFAKPENTNLGVKDCWSIISPLITLALGYLFGEKTSENS